LIIEALSVVGLSVNKSTGIMQKKITRDTKRNRVTGEYDATNTRLVGRHFCYDVRKIFSTLVTHPP
jgi:hypothetical protein